MQMAGDIYLEVGLAIAVNVALDDRLVGQLDFVQLALVMCEG